MGKMIHQMDKSVKKNHQKYCDPVGYEQQKVSKKQMKKGMYPGMGPNQGMYPGMGGNPGMGMNQGMGMPPQGNGTGMPPQRNGMGMPPQGNGMGMPPQGNGMGMPPQGNGMRMPPQGNGTGMPTHGNGMGMPQQGNGMGMNPGIGGNPGMGMNQGMGMPPQGNGTGIPPQGNGMGMPPQGNGMGMPQQGNGMGMPPQGNGMGMLPQGKGMGMPPQGNSTGIPPQGNGTGMPPQGNGNGMPPQGNGMAMPPQGNGMGMPPQGNGMGMPLQGNGMGMPPQGNGMGMPPQGNGMGMPPQGNGTGMPPQGNGMGMPPQGNGMGMPPQGNGMGMPPQGNGMGMPQGNGMPNPGGMPGYPEPPAPYKEEINVQQTSTDETIVKAKWEHQSVVGSSDAGVWSKRTVVLITGASQHIGAAIAQWFSTKLSPESLLILSSRSKDRLEKTIQGIKQVNPALNVQALSWDLEKPSADTFTANLKDCLKGKEAKTFEQAIIIHNAASIGDMKTRVIDMKDKDKLQEQININLISMLLLNSVFLDIFAGSKRTVVNMTATSAVNPRACFGLTSMVKSSRQIMLSILAIEEPSVRVLHFDPVAVDSNSLREIRDTAHDPEIRDWIKGFYDRNEILTPQKVAQALGETLVYDDFENGSVVDAVSFSQ